MFQYSVNLALPDEERDRCACGSFCGGIFEKEAQIGRKAEGQETRSFGLTDTFLLSALCEEIYVPGDTVTDATVTSPEEGYEDDEGTGASLL